MNEKEYKTSEYVVAFIDILGATNAISKQADDSLDLIHKIYENAIETFSQLKTDDFDMPQIKIFSDNIVIAVRYDSNHSKKDAAISVAVMSAALQANFLAHGWLTRGGISSGKFFIDDVMVWGPALVDAYKLENSVAYFPRVIIDPKLATEFYWTLAATRTNEFASMFSAFHRDSDGMIRVEYIVAEFDNTVRAIFDEYENGFIEKQLSEYKGNTKILQKWLWMDNYIKERRKVLLKEGDKADAASNERQRG